MVSANRLGTVDELTRCRRAAGRVSTKLLGALVAALLAFAAIAWWLGARQAASNARAERSTCALPA